MDNLNLETFLPVRLRDRGVFVSFFAQNCPMSCEMNFVNLFSWGRVYDMKWKNYKNRLVIYNEKQDWLLMPVGQYFKPEELAEISAEFVAQGKDGKIAQVPDDYLFDYPKTLDYFTSGKLEDHAEYIYETDALYRLRGRKLSKKKNLVSQFQKRYPKHKVIDLRKQPELLKNCLELVEQWQDFKDESKSINQEFAAMKIAFENFAPLELEGLAITVNEKVIAFSIFSRHNMDTYDVHFEKADFHFKGSAQAINRVTAKYLLPKCGYINREQDLGDEGLRQAKRSYDPVFILLESRLYPK